MAVPSLVFAPSLALSCPCSCSTTCERSFIGPTAGSNPYSHLRNGALIRRKYHPSALNLASHFVDSLGCTRLTKNAGLQIESSKRLHRKTGVVMAGLPVVSSIPVLGPVVNAVLNPVVLMVIYLAGASRFWSGFNRTTYSSSTPTKLALTAMWPALYVASKGYRTNFKKAVL